MRSQRHIPLRPIHLPLAALAATTAALILTASPVAAAAPANDSFADGEALSLGAPVVADTTEATQEELDLEVVQACPFGAPPSTKTVWYRWDSGADPPPTVSVLASGSLFPPFFAVATGEPGSFTTLTCGSAVVFETEPDVTYHVMLLSAFDRGGTTTLVLDEARPPTIEFTVDPVGRFDAHAGTAAISGDYRCADAMFGNAFGQLTQDVGRFAIVGFLGFELECDGQTHLWTAVATSDTGLFRGGKASARIDVGACAIPLCVDITVEQTISLRR